jgi:hypothetical protein
MIKKFITIVVTGLALSSCVSMNVKSYKLDSSDFNEYANKITKKYSLNSVRMTTGDINSIQCRLVGNIYLPKKMTYSQYIYNSLKKAMIATNIHDEKSTPVDIHINVVNYSSNSGQWYIQGHLNVGNESPILISTVSDYGTAYFAHPACENTAEAFPEAVTHFNQKIFENLK